MKLKHLLLLLMTVVSFSATRAADEWKNVKFNPDVRYSQWVLDSRLGDFYGNTKRMGFATFNQDLSAKTEFPTWTKEGKTQTVTMDYVAGLVAKAAVEAAILYQDYDWSKPWFKSVMSYANYKDNEGNGINITNAGGSLDDLNAAKMFFGLYALANGNFSSIAGDMATKAQTQLQNAQEGLVAHNKGYSFPSGTTLNDKDVSGGWYHKSNYQSQMWLDGQYMGPALLAQLIKNGYSPITGTIDGDWDLIAKQFTIVWEQCWDDKEKLLYHAFSSVANSTWADDAEIWTTRGTDTSNWTGLSAGGHSAAFWGRAEGWYFLALVDVLEQMPTDNKNYAILKGYLDELAAGIAARQDKTTGCWYQLLAKDGTYSAQYYNGKEVTAVSNYLESSCTAIFTAAYLKGARLKLFGDKNAEYTAIAKNAYEGLVNQFMKQKEDGTVELVGCSRSAGLGTTAVGTNKFRDGSNAYYLQGYDVTPTPVPSSYPNTVTDGKYTEGKVLGAFILAATEYERLPENEKPVLLTLDLHPECKLDGKTALEVAVNGNGNETYQWYEKTNGAISGAQSATYTPTNDGIYYCAITVPATSSSAKGRIAARAAAYTLTSSETNVTVTAETEGGVKYERWFYEPTDSKEAGFTNTTFFTFSTALTGGSSFTGSCTIDGTSYSVTRRAGNANPDITFKINEGDKGTLYVIANGSGRIFTLKRESATVEQKGLENNVVEFSALTSGEYTLNADKNVGYAFLCMKLESASSGDLIDPDLHILGTRADETSNYVKNSNAWTPAAGGTIALSELVTSASAGAYRISAGDAATLSADGTTLTAVKNGAITLSQAAAGGYASGSVDINIAIGDNVTDNTVNAYTFPTSSETVVSDGMTIALKDITMTFGNDGFWKKAGTNNGYTSGQNGPKPSKDEVPTLGTYYKFVPAKDGSLAVNISIGANKRLYVVESDATPIEAKDKDGNVITGSASAASYTGDVTFNVAANKTYYVYVDGSKANFYGFAFTPSAETPIEGDVIATFEKPSENKNDKSWVNTEKNTITIERTDGSLQLEDNNSAVRVGTSDGYRLKLTIPSGVTMTAIKFEAKSSSSSQDATVSITGTDISKTFTLVKGGSYEYQTVTFDPSVTGEQVLYLKASGDNAWVKNIIIYGEDKTVESNSNATFKYESSDLTFTKVEGAENTYEATIEVGAEKKNTNLGITLSTASGATVVCDGGTVSDDKTIVTVTAPASIGSTVTCTVIVTSADGTSTTTYKITVKLKKQTIVLKYVLNDNSKDATAERKANAEWFWDKLANPSKEFTANTLVLHAYIADSKGNATDKELTSLPSGITYESDMPSVATVDKYNGTITLVGNSLGRAYIYATFAGNEDYEAAETRCAVYIRDGYTYNVTDADKNTPPTLNAFRYITDKDGKTLVRMKFGGWKYNKGKYIKPSVCQGSNWTSASDEDYVTDGWGSLESSGVIGIDGFTAGFPGNNDACNESMSAEKHYKKTRYGWFKAPSDNDNNLHDPNNITVTYPFTLPVRGAYMTFEPMMNGTLSVFVVQNGAWNTWNKKSSNPHTYVHELDDVVQKEYTIDHTFNKGDIKLGEFRPHSFQVVNQRGLTLSQFATKWSVDTKRDVTATNPVTGNKLYCNQKEKGQDPFSDNVALWPEFKGGRLTDGEQKDIVEAWAGGPRGHQKIVMLHDGSFLAVQKCIVKYTFHVTGHETYYFFSNFSKMGFCGANFTPDPDTAQPTATLELNDQVAYPTVKATETGEYYDGNSQMPTFGGKELPKIKKHTFTVTKADGTKIDGVNVEGVQAPQFKTITVQRDFKQGQWTTLTLPFNMTQKKVEEVFGVGTELLLLKSSEMNGSAVRLHFIYHEIQNVLPGYPYLIKPTLKDADGNNYSNGTTDASTIVETDGALVLTSFNVPVKHITQAAEQLTFGKPGPYILKGVEKYCTPKATDKYPFSVNLKEGDVFLSDSNGKFYVSKGASYCKGYRAYMTTADPQVTPAKSVILTYSGVEDNPDNGTATEISIAELSPDAVMTLGLKGVYNLSGQKVADTADNLPAGIYVVNGQKIVVK
ncbi:MAG: glycoside hydrolase family 88 protein [Prevotella sp.]|nr:glycoside hydrolase family 88 protein [Prevotella sp.]